ncbi:hypothetical protein DIPPA_18873 [Diplonema papillatum]|nr:hypothetical protein DIPPA_18873 [Diplonema papillatum]
MTAGDYSTTTQQSTAGPTAPLMPPTVPTSMPPVMQPTPGMQTTNQHTAIESSAFGPATYVGGAPLPREASKSPTPDRIHRETIEFKVAQKKEKRAEAERKREEHKVEGGCLGGIKDAVTVCSAKTSASMAERSSKSDAKTMRRDEEHNQHRFLVLFPSDRDYVRAAYKCKYTNGQSDTIDGIVFLSNSHIRFAGNEDGTREMAAWKNVVSLEGIGKPPRINVYTADKHVLQFAMFEAMDHALEDGPTHLCAMNWMDHLWRETASVPHSAAVYFSS